MTSELVQDRTSQYGYMQDLYHNYGVSITDLAQYAHTSRSHVHRILKRQLDDK